MSSDSKASAAARRKFDFPYYIDVQTRWLDNDQYGHLNNTAYYLITDTINNTYLFDHCGIQPFVDESQRNSSPSQSDGSPSASSVVGLVISSSAEFFASTSFPDTLRCGLRVIKLGSSSVTWEIGVFRLPPQPASKRSSSMSAFASNSSSQTAVMISQQSLPSDAQAAALVRVTHVFVDRKTRRPVKPMPAQVREGLERLRKEAYSIDIEADQKARL